MFTAVTIILTLLICFAKALVAPVCTSAASSQTAGLCPVGSYAFATGTSTTICLTASMTLMDNEDNKVKQGTTVSFTDNNGNKLTFGGVDFTSPSAGSTITLSGGLITAFALQINLNTLTFPNSGCTITEVAVSPPVPRKRAGTDVATPITITSAGTSGTLEAGSSGDPHITGPRGEKFDFKGQPGATYALLSSRRLAVNMRVDNLAAGKGPAVRYMTDIAVVIGNVSVVFDTSSHDAQYLAQLNKQLALVNASAVYADNGNNAYTIIVTVCPGQNIVVSQMYTKPEWEPLSFGLEHNVYYLDIELEMTAGCHDDFDGIIGRVGFTTDLDEAAAEERLVSEGQRQLASCHHHNRLTRRQRIRRLRKRVGVALGPVNHPTTVTTVRMLKWSARSHASSAARREG